MPSLDLGTELISPYGGSLVDLLVPSEEHADVAAYASGLPSLQVSDRVVCDLELLATGAFSPLDRFMGRLDHARVVDDMRLQSGALFPIPVTLPIEPDADVHLDADLALRSPKNELLAVLTVDEIYGWDADEVAS